MNGIPGLDMLNSSGDGLQPPSIFDVSFEIQMNTGNMRTEKDFTYKCQHKMKAPLSFCKGVDEQNNREVSLLVYNDNQEPDDELTDILDELKIINGLNHKNVLKFYETIAGSKLVDVAFVFEPHSFLLSQIIKYKITWLYEPPMIKAIMKELLTGLDYLHKNCIIHRDIQPENLVLTSTGVLKIWNFRNARRFNQKPKNVIAHDFRYQAVELLMESEKYDETVDIWSANCIFAELWLKKSFCTDHGRERVLDGIFSLLGFPKKEIWEEFFSLPGVNDLVVLRNYEYNILNKYFRKNCDQVVSPNAMDLLHRCFRYNPINRPKTEYCLLHPYFMEKPAASTVEGFMTLLEHARICDQIRGIKEGTNH